MRPHPLIWKLAKLTSFAPADNLRDNPSAMVPIVEQEWLPNRSPQTRMEPVTFANAKLLETHHFVTESIKDSETIWWVTKYLKLFIVWLEWN
jgi:hypothetical protein